MSLRASLAFIIADIMQRLFTTSIRQASLRRVVATPRAVQPSQAGLLQQRFQSSGKPDRAVQPSPSFPRAPAHTVQNSAVQGGEVGPSDEPPVTSEDEVLKKPETDEGGIAGEQGRQVQDTEDIETPPEGKGKMGEEQQPHAGRQG